ncbi:MAG: sigma-70 family RNA polymerase sigma factor [Deltaproteobacteria bacterium]|nr:sigma-70 family RNA polymerase sigma factor [Deltaproteobacteria bacterium]
MVRRLRPADQGDAVLVSALRAGDQAAYTELFDRHAPTLTRVILRIIGTPADVPELVNEAMFRAIRRIHDLEAGDCLKSWLCAIAVNVSREHVRARTRRRWFRWIGLDDASELPAPAADFEHREAARELYRILDELPVDDRIVFAMRYLDDRELTDVAQACGVSLATVKRRLVRAEKRIALLGRKSPSLRGWLEGGARWASR